MVGRLLLHSSCYGYMMQKQDDLILKKNCCHNRHYTQLKEIVLLFWRFDFFLYKDYVFFSPEFYKVDKKRAPLLCECVRFSAYPDLPRADNKKAEHFY